MRRWIFFLITFVTFSALFLLVSGEYADRGTASPIGGGSRRTTADGSRFVVRIVDEAGSVLRAILRAKHVDLMGDLVTLESIRGLQLGEIEMEMFLSDDRRTVRVLSPAGRVLKKDGPSQASIDLEAEFTGGVVVDIPLLESETTLRTGAVRLSLSGPHSAQQRLLASGDLGGRSEPVRIEGLDPFLRIEAEGIEADLSEGSSGSIRLLPPVRAEGDATLARKLAIVPEAKASRDDRIQLETGGDVWIRGFLMPDGSPAISPEGETRILFEERTKISGPDEKGGVLEANRMRIQFVEAGAPADEGPEGGARGVEIGRAEVVGDVVFRHRDAVLEAASVVWDAASESAVATGAPTLRQKSEGVEREISADRIAFYPAEYRVYLDGHVAGKRSGTSGKAPEEEIPSPTTWKFLADHFQLKMEKGEGDEKLRLSWGEAWSDEGGPLVISDEQERTLISGQRLSFTAKQATLHAGESPCLLKYGESRFWADRVDVDLDPNRVRLSGGVRGSILPEDLGGRLPEELDEGKRERIDVTADEIVLDVREDATGEAPGAGEVGHPSSMIRSVRARGWTSPAKIETGGRGIEGRELIWDFENERMTAGGDGSRPHLWDETKELEAGSVEVRRKEGKADLAGGVRGSVTDEEGRRLEVGGESLEITFSAGEGGKAGWGGIRSARAEGRQGKELWVEGDLGRLEGGEAEWNNDEGWLRFSGAAGCTFSGELKDGTTVDLRAQTIELNMKEQWLDLRGAIRGTITPSGLPGGDGGEGERVRKAEEDPRLAGKDLAAPWTVRCENARIAYDLEEGVRGPEIDGMGARSVIRSFHADGGEGLIVIESPENRIRLAGTRVEYERESGWLRMTGSEAFQPRLEMGEEGENVIISREVALHFDERAIVFEDEEDAVRATFHSETIRKVVPGASDKVPDLLWELSSKRIVARVPEGWNRVEGLDLEAEGPVQFRAGDLEVKADRAVYDGGKQTLAFEGDPGRATDGENAGTFEWVEFDFRQERVDIRGAKGWIISPEILKKLRRAKK